MATYTVTINERTSIGKSLATLLSSMRDVVQIKKQDSPQKKGLDIALDDVKNGRVYKAKSVDDMMKKILD